MPHQPRELPLDPFKLVSLPQPTLASLTPPPGPEKKFDILDIELIQHYCTKTYLTISSRLATHVIWRDTVFREAFRHEWLLYGIMATAAFHKASQFPKSSKGYASVALAHQESALKGYIARIGHPNQANGIAIFSLSLLCTIWAFASKDLPESLKRVGGTSATDATFEVRLPPTSPTNQFAQIISCLRGIYTVMLETKQWLQGDIEEMLRFPRESELPAHTSELAQAYDILAEAVQSYDGAEITNIKDMFIEHVVRLRNISRCREVVEWDSHIFSFFIMAPVQYIDCLKQANPVALVIFAHWAACFRCMDHHWWAHGWPQTLVHDVSNLLDLRVWSKAMEWPMRQCGLLYSDGPSYESHRLP